MTAKRDDRSDLNFERALSYLLILGVMASLTLEVIGIALFRQSDGGFAISENRAMMIDGKDFFRLIGGFVRGHFEGTPGPLLMTLGIAILILTPYLRVVMSVVYFAWTRNTKYILITLFVLVVVSVNLAFH